MSQPFVGEIRMFAGTFAPAGWAFCNGQRLSIAENDVLFQLIGTIYGGDGQSTFALPDLSGRIPIHAGTGAGGANHTLGELGGVENVTVTSQELPNHTHTLLGSTSPASPLVGPLNSLVADTSASGSMYDVPGAGASVVSMSSSAIGAAGGTQSHNNMAPYLCVSFIISLFGIFPAQS